MQFKQTGIKLYKYANTFYGRNKEKKKYNLTKY